MNASFGITDVLASLIANAEVGVKSILEFLNIDFASFSEVPVIEIILEPIPIDLLSNLLSH